MKILGCDYDGTLNHGGFGEEKVAALRAWRACGNKLGVVSGRGLRMLPIIEKECGLSLDFFVACNGAVIYNAEVEGLHEMAFTAVDPTALVEDLFTFGCTEAHVNSDRYYLIRKNAADCGNGEYALQDVKLPVWTYQVSVELSTEGDAARIVEQLERKYGHILSSLQNGRCVDIVAKGVGKAAGMKRVQEQFNARWEDVLVVGDNLNDVDMLQAFTSYAMENGVEDVKKIATYTTKSVTELILRELKGFS